MTKRFKIEPDLTCTELAGYKLPPFSRGQEDGVEVMAELEYREYPSDPKGSGFQNNRDINCHRKRRAFIKGYTKAREKYEFTEDDMKYIFECGRNYQNNAEVTFKVSIDHLRTPRTPIAIEVEYELDEFPLTNPDGTVKGVYVYE